MKRIIITLATSLAILSCQHKETDLIEEQTKGNLHAETENIDSKTTLNDDHQVIWNSGDMVAVFNESTLNQPYLVTDGTEGSVSCDLECTGSSDEGSDVGDILVHKVAYYPYSSEVTCASNDSGGYTISDIEIETEQRYEEGAFASGSFPMVAVNSGDNLSFKNICGAIMVQVKGQVKIRKVTLTGNNKEKLCGKATITAYPDKAPEIIFKGRASTSISLDCGTGVELSKKTAEPFILTIPPTTFEDGFTLIMTDTDGEKHQFKTERKSVISRSCMLVMDVIDLSESDQTETPETPETPDTEETPDTPVNIQHEGIQYIWDDSVIPEITINVSVDEWNRLLGLYDQNSNTKEYIKCNVTYTKGSETTEIIDAGIRLRGNTSRRRPEASQTHSKDNADWQHCHFGVNLRKFNKDNDNIKVKDIKGIRKFNLKWFKDDACYVRELFCYDLFRRAGIWTAAHDVYCRLWIHVEGDSKPAYYGVYELIEPYDNKYVEKREHLFGSADGNLWKCSYDSHGPADLSNPDANMAEDNDRDDFTYELKEYGDHSDFETAKAQLQDFILKLNGKAHGTPGDSFYKWIKEVCDVDLLMRTYAVNVAVGMWDDLWNNGNNYYLYFTTSDKYAYKVYFIPYDYDNSLGTSNAYDAAKQDPYNWGNKGVLMNRMMEYEEFRQIYRDELKRLVDPANGLMDTESSIARIKAWQAKIKQYISNDTGEDMEIRDEPAYWGNWGDYNLMDYNNNYFTVKAETINNLR